MRRLSHAVIVALLLGWSGLVTGAARALPPPTRHCGFYAPGVPLRAGDLVATGYPPPSCRGARQVVQRFLRTGARDIDRWTCERPLQQDRDYEVIASCARDPHKSYRSFISFYVRDR